MASDPPTYAPMLSGTAAAVPAGDGWAFEIKWDGFRAIARARGDDVKLWSRNGKRLDTTHRAIAAALPRALTRPDCVVDG
jgi:bifunctional non-homologous end joining protein LigD